MHGNDQGMTKDQSQMTKERRFGIRSFGLGHSLVILLLGLFPLAAQAHPVPRSDTDRNVTVTWRPDGVFVQYRVEIDEFTLLTSVAQWVNDLPGDPKKKPVGPKEVAQAYMARM